MGRLFGKAPFIAILTALVVCALLLVVCRSEDVPAKTKPAETKPTPSTTAESSETAKAAAASADTPAHAKITAIAPPPFTPGMFPCMGCHEELTPNPTQRQLKIRHKDIVLHHDEQNRWCLDCHTSGDLNHLHLASGKLIEFTESYKLCGQCHGPTLRAWEAGEHGKRTGSWSGDKQYLLCANCHNPHSPHFKPLQPLPPPVRPESLRKSDNVKP